MRKVSQDGVFPGEERAQAIAGETVVYMYEVMKHELQTNSWKFCFVRYSVPIVIGIPR